MQHEAPYHPTILIALLCICCISVKVGSVDIKRTLEELLLQLSLCDLDLHGLVNLLGMSSLVVCVVLDCSGEKRIDEGRLSQSRLASHL